MAKTLEEAIQDTKGHGNQKDGQQRSNECVKKDYKRTSLSRCICYVLFYLFIGSPCTITNVVMAASYNWPRSLPALLLRVLLVYSD